MPAPGPGSAAAATTELGVGAPEGVANHCGHRRRRAAREPTTAGGTSMAAVMVGAPKSRIYTQR